MGYCIVGIGEILWDLFPEGKQMGGAPANFAFHANQLSAGDADCYVVSCVGDDDLGRQLDQQLERMSLEREYIFNDHCYKTGTVTVSVDNAGVPLYRIEENAAWDFIPHLPAELAASTDVVCFGTLAQRGEISRETIQSFLGKTRKNALRIFDINLRQNYYSEDIIISSLDLANILKINDEELRILSALLNLYGGEADILRQICTAYKIALGVLTRGVQGSLLVTEDRISVHPGFPVKMVDSVGAGDAFAAAIAIGLLKGQDLDCVNDQANRIASFVCSKAGATPILSAEIKSLLTS